MELAQSFTEIEKKIKSITTGLLKECNFHYRITPNLFRHFKRACCISAIEVQLVRLSSAATVVARPPAARRFDRCRLTEQLRTAQRQTCKLRSRSWVDDSTLFGYPLEI